MKKKDLLGWLLTIVITISLLYLVTSCVSNREMRKISKKKNCPPYLYYKPKSQ